MWVGKRRNEIGIDVVENWNHSREQVGIGIILKDRVGGRGEEVRG